MDRVPGIDEVVTRDDPYMTETEALMWRLGSDPALSSSFGSVSLLDRPIDLERFRRRLSTAVAMIPRLHQRVVDRPLGLTPMWVDVADVDLDQHIQQATLPHPGTMRQLLDMSTSFVAGSFDLSRPFWEVLIVDGLDDGRAAIVQRMHHTLSDAENGIRLALQFADRERDAPEEPPGLNPGSGDASIDATRPSAANFLGAAINQYTRRSLGLVRSAGRTAVHPFRLIEQGARIAASVRGTTQHARDAGRARSPLWVERSLHRHLEVLRVPLEPFMQVAHLLGGTFNTAFLTAVSAAAGAYHRELGAPVETLRATVAISTRTEESGPNAFTVIRLRVPTGDMGVPDRFASIQRMTNDALNKAGLAHLASVAAWSGPVPTPVLLALARRMAGTVDFVTSNIRTPPFACYIAGARIDENYPIGPLPCVPFNLTVLSYNGSLDMGLHVDPAAVTEPTLLRECLEEAFRELLAIAWATLPGPRA
jgi:diacylglycerol O-acyltransferase